MLNLYLIIIFFVLTFNSNAEIKEKIIQNLKNTKTSIRASFIKGLQRIGGFGGKSDLLAYSEVYTGDPGRFNDFYADMLSTTKQEIQKTASDWLTDGVYVLIVAPEDQMSFSQEAIADRSKLPFPESFPKLNLPEIQRAKLSNGIDVVFAERHDVPMINLSLLLGSGHSSDSSDKPGLASFTMSMLTEGTERYDALDLSDKLDELGTDLYTSTGLDSSSVTLSALKSNFIESLDLMIEVINKPTFDQVEIDRKKLRWLASIDQSLSTPNGIVSNLISGLMYGKDHPYGKPSSGDGTRQSIQWMTRQDMIGYKESTITAANSTIVVIGDTNLEELLPILESKFGNWKREANKTKPLNYEVSNQSSARKIYLFDKPGAIQSLIVAGQLLPANGTDDEIDIDLMNRVIGGSFTSRLNMNLREDKSWSYGVRARLSSRKGPRPMLVYAPVQSDRTVDSIKEIQREYSEYLSSRPASNEELDPIKQQIILGLNGQFETFGSLLSGVSGIVTFDRGDDYLNAVPQKYNAVTLDQVNAAAQKYLDPETWTWFIVGDLSIIEDDIRNLGLGEVEIIVLD